jgi:hypothetical protein
MGMSLKSLIASIDVLETLRLSASAASIGGYDCSKIQARLKGATSQILGHPCRDDDDELLRQYRNGEIMPWKQLFQEPQARTAVEIKSPAGFAAEIGQRRMGRKNFLEKNGH